MSLAATAPANAAPTVAAPTAATTGSASRNAISLSGITRIFGTHGQHEALGMSDRIAVMGKGRIQLPLTGVLRSGLINPGDAEMRNLSFLAPLRGAIQALQPDLDHSAPVKPGGAAPVSATPRSRIK